MNTETRNCQNCKSQFVIEPDDFAFYEKMQVPPPTFCPECRFQRRLMFRNERVFYKRNCELCGASVVARFAPDRGYRVYCQPCWWSDKWDGADYGADYDPAKPFFAQVKELSLRTPHPSLLSDYSTLVNSDYVNYAGTMKNCYLTFNADYCENVAYCTNADYAKDSLDAYLIGSSELCYEAINCDKCFRTYFSEDCVSCMDVYFSKDLSGCSNCFGCAGLRNKQYYWFNEPVGKDEFTRRLKDAGLGSRSSVKNMRKDAEARWLAFPQKFFHGTHNANVSGDYIYESKNARDMYQVRSVEDGRYCQFITLPTGKDVYDWTEWGAGAELVCDAITVGGESRNIKYCVSTWSGAGNAEYCNSAPSCRDVFGCVNLKKKQYCILNKQYAKDEYEALRKRIIGDMNARPYIDGAGREWKYGDFFPYDLSPFAYNESHAIQYYPLTKEEALEKGLAWRDPAPSPHKITVSPEQLPDGIGETPETIVNEILGCGRCGKAYRLIPSEFSLLKRFNIPVPGECPDCRHMRRMKRINPPKLWSRTCAKCGASIQTSYSSDRPEIVYCEACYQAEVV